MDPASSRNPAQKIPVRQVNGKSVIRPGEALTRKNCDLLNACFDDLIERGDKDMIMDLSQVHFLDSVALESLINVQNRLAGLNGTLSLSNVDEVCRDILISVRVISRFPIISSHRTTGTPRK